MPDADRAAIAAYLVDDIAKHNGHLAVGIIGMKHLMRALTATGNSDIAVNISLQTDYPSFGFTFNHEYEPATTLWELWNGPTEGPGMLVQRAITTHPVRAPIAPEKRATFS